MNGPLFNKIALIGIGLIGGSIALEARKRGLANSIVAATRKPETAALRGGDGDDPSSVQSHGREQERRRGAARKDEAAGAARHDSDEQSQDQFDIVAKSRFSVRA